jgi:hypothetical protein
MKKMYLYAPLFFAYFPLLLEAQIALSNTASQRVRFSFIFGGEKCSNTSKRKLERGGYYLEPGTDNGFENTSGDCSIIGIKLKGRVYTVSAGGRYRIVSDGRKDFWIEELK